LVGRSAITANPNICKLNVRLFLYLAGYAK